MKGYPDWRPVNQRFEGYVPHGNEEGRPTTAGGAASGCSEPGSGQNASSGRSISARSVPSAMARSAVSLGSWVRAKNCAAATLPS